MVSHLKTPAGSVSSGHTIMLRKKMTATGKEAEKERGGTRVLFIRWKGKQCARKLGRHSKLAP